MSWPLLACCLGGALVGVFVGFAVAVLFVPIVATAAARATVDDLVTAGRVTQLEAEKRRTDGGRRDGHR